MIGTATGLAAIEVCATKCTITRCWALSPVIDTPIPQSRDAIYHFVTVGASVIKWLCVPHEPRALRRRDAPRLQLCAAALCTLVEQERELGFRLGVSGQQQFATIGRRDRT
jgi:hypothetical protein